MLCGDTRCNLDTTLRDREVGGSNPLAPTNQFNNLRRSVTVAVLVLWQDCRRSNRLNASPLQRQLSGVVYLAHSRSHKFGT